MHLLNLILKATLCGTDLRFYVILPAHSNDLDHRLDQGWNSIAYSRRDK
jgi:hypothetical protein